jgi:hypothetical protein
MVEMNGERITMIILLLLPHFPNQQDFANLVKSHNRQALEASRVMKWTKRHMVIYHYCRLRGRREVQPIQSGTVPTLSQEMMSAEPFLVDMFNLRQRPTMH